MGSSLEDRVPVHDLPEALVPVHEPTRSMAVNDLHHMGISKLPKIQWTTTDQQRQLMPQLMPVQARTASS
jgi:hypothetical protein